LLSGTKIAGSNSFIAGTSTVGPSDPNGMTMYEIDGVESLIVADFGTQQIVHLSNVNSNNINVSVLLPYSLPDGDHFYFLFDLFLDVRNEYNVYVSDSGNNRVLTFYSMQDVIPPLIVIDGVPGVYNSAPNALDGPYGVQRDNQGNLYVIDIYNHRVMRWAPNATSGEMIAGNDTLGNSSMELSYPYGLFLGTHNSLLYVADTGNNRIQLFNLTTGTIPYNDTTVAGGNGPGAGNDQLNQPSDLCPDRHDLQKNA
jgi:hypothetical protein